MTASRDAAGGGAPDAALADFHAALAYLRGMGFFAHDPDDAVLLRRLREEWGPGYPEPGPWGFLQDYLLVVHDTERVFDADTECDPWPGEETYVRWVEGIARVGRGHLRLRGVEERWLTDPIEHPEVERPVEVVVHTDRRTLRVRPRQHGDYVHDHDLLDALDPLMPRRGPRFHGLDTGGQDACILALTSDERRRLERDRGWRFTYPRPRPRTTPLAKLRAMARRAWDASMAPFRT